MKFGSLVGMKHIVTAFFIVCFTTQHVKAQTDTVELNYIADYYFENLLPYSAYTSCFHEQGEPYIYAACRDLGVVPFDITDVANPLPIDTVALFALNGFKPTNLSQHGNYLYVATGGFDGFAQNAGLTILDIGDPTHPVIKDLWDSIAFNQGAAIVITDGDYAYLGGMEEGVIILDVKDKTHIKYVSSILPDPNFPEVPGLFSVPNARGLAFYGEDKLLVANDAGGLRVIDISNKLIPVEIEKYVNTDIEDIAQSAYNNIVVVDHYAYITVDMCGMEVVDLNTNPISNVMWFNPWDCDSTNWIGRPGHTNEIKSVGDSLLFVSGGDSELLIFDITERTNPRLVGSYANVLDSIATWAIDVRYPYVSLALINNEIFGVPFYSNVGGIALLEWNAVPVVGIEETSITALQMYPNPVINTLHVILTSGAKYYLIKDISGRNIFEGTTNNNNIDCTSLNAGMYMINLFDTQGVLSSSGVFIKQ